MFRFVKQIFVSAMMFFGCNVSSVNSSKCILMNNQECKIRPEKIILPAMNLYFVPTALMYINAVVVVIISMIHMQNCVFLILLKT